MHLLHSLAVTLATVPSIVLAAGTLGFALGANKPDGSCKTSDDYALDFDAIKAASGSTVVRGYATDQCGFAQQILPAAKAKGFKVILGLWPDTDEAFSKDKAALANYAPQYVDQVYAVTVGSETLYRGNFTGKELLGKIQEVKKILPQTKVGTADSWNKFNDGTADDLIHGGVDILLVNAFSYWQGQEIGNATATYFDDIYRAFSHIQSVAGSCDKIELWNGETGWPTDGGSDYQAAKAGTKNAQSYFSAVCGLLNWNINVFYFEAFDEPNKAKSVGDTGKAADETHWGALNADRSLKFPLKC